MAFTKLSFYSPATKKNQDINIYYPDPINKPRQMPFGQGNRPGGDVFRRFTPHKRARIPDGTIKYSLMVLVHGGGANYMRWPVETTIETLSNENECVIAMPSVPDRQESMDYFGTTEFIANELPAYLSYLFPISEDPKDRYIGGFSFGGYFAWRTGILHPEVYGTVATFSSPVDIITDLELRPQENYDLEELKTNDHNLLWLIEQKVKNGEPLPRLFESFGDETDMCSPVNKTAIEVLNKLVGIDGFYWTQGLGPHSLTTCDALIRKFFIWLNDEKAKAEAMKEGN